MTLRVTVEIVPFGEEENKRTIGILNIHNVKSFGLGLCEYVADVKTWDWNNREETRHLTNIRHTRQDGFWELTRKTINAILARS